MLTALKVRFSGIDLLLIKYIKDARTAQYMLDFGTTVEGGESRVLRTSNYTYLLTSMPATSNPATEYNFYPNTTILPGIFYFPQLT